MDHLSSSPSPQEGQRLNFASPEVIEHLLDIGYLELECLMNGQLVHKQIKRSETQPGQLSYHVSYAGELAALSPAIFRNLAHLQGVYDLHAYRWYPSHPSFEEGLKGAPTQEESGQDSVSSSQRKSKS